VEFNATTSTDATGTIIQYCFDFGDGNSTDWISDSVVSHAYAALGNYTAFVKVRDSLGQEDDLSNQITISVKSATVQNQPGPTARFFVRPLYTYPWETVYFNGSISEAAVGRVVEYLYDFGDGTTSGWVLTPEVSHSFDTPGNFTVRLLVMDSQGAVSAKSALQTVWVREVVNSPPHASFTLWPSKAGINTTVTLNASASADKDGIVFRFLFDFGDGSDSGWVFNGVTTHTYAVAGNYTARVMVEDDAGARSNWSATHNLEILGNAPPRPYLFVRPHTAAPGQYLSFNATGSTDPDGFVVEYFFDFGDGTSSGWTSLSIVQHSYAVCGTYIVQLLVRDNQGEVSHASSRTSVDVKNAPPKATVTVVDPNISAAVIALFVVIMIVGAIYETRKRRLAERAAGAGQVQAYPPGDAGPAGQEAPAPEASWAPAGGVPPEAAQRYESPEPPWYQDAPAPSDGGGEPPVAYAGPEALRATCSGCGMVLAVPDGRRPIRFTCPGCGRAGVLR
jgi:PKD repeat protein